VTVDAEGKPHDLGGLVDGEPVRAGQIVRVVTTGGGGWGDPLEREPELVQRDVIEGKVSLVAARDDYGVVLKPDAGGEPANIDVQATAALRDKLKAGKARAQSMIDRGDGFEKMIRGEIKPWTRSA
jgi:N-methylhydantoinase B